MSYIFYGLFILSCIVLIASVLLQPGKADAGALFTSSVSSTAFGPRGTQSVLSKITIGAAVAFMLSALMLAQPAITGNRSVLQSTTRITPATPDANANAANANVATDANANIAITNANVLNANVVPAANTATPANVAVSTDKKAAKPADTKANKK